MPHNINFKENNTFYNTRKVQLCCLIPHWDRKITKILFIEPRKIVRVEDLKKKQKLIIMFRQFNL